MAPRSATGNPVRRALTFAALGFAVAMSFLFGSVQGTSAATVTSSGRPVIVSLSFPSSVSHLGGRSVVKARLSGVTNCRVTIANHPLVSARITQPTQQGCTQGTLRAVVKYGANTRNRRVPIKIDVVLIGTTGRLVRTFVIWVSKAPDASQEAGTTVVTPPTALLSANTLSFPSAGGQLLLTFSSTAATSCQLTASPAIWSGAPTSVPCSGSYSAQILATSLSQHWTVVFSAGNGKSAPATATVVITQLGSTTGFSSSLNWSGYIASSTTIVESAAGQWVVPPANCSSQPGQTTYAGIWVGIGGAQGGDPLLQTGVNVVCVGGQQVNQPFWEEVPANPNNSVNFKDFPVAIGDVMTGTVFLNSSGYWETELDDSMSGLSAVSIVGVGWAVFETATLSSASPALVGDSQGTSTALTYPGGHSAEWIVEDIGASPLPFANYGAVTFTGLSTSIIGWSLTNDGATEIAQGGVILSVPTLPTSNSSFDVLYVAPGS